MSRLAGLAKIIYKKHCKEREEEEEEKGRAGIINSLIQIGLRFFDALRESEN